MGPIPHNPLSSEAVRSLTVTMEAFNEAMRNYADLREDIATLKAQNKEIYRMIESMQTSISKVCKDVDKVESFRDRFWGAAAAISAGVSLIVTVGIGFLRG